MLRAGVDARKVARHGARLYGRAQDALPPRPERPGFHSRMHFGIGRGRPESAAAKVKIRTLREDRSELIG